jgi:hypothetical protein
MQFYHCRYNNNSEAAYFVVDILLPLLTQVALADSIFLHTNKIQLASRVLQPLEINVNFSLTLNSGVNFFFCRIGSEIIVK